MDPFRDLDVFKDFFSRPDPEPLLWHRLVKDVGGAEVTPARGRGRTSDGGLDQQGIGFARRR